MKFVIGQDVTNVKTGPPSVGIVQGAVIGSLHSIHWPQFKHIFKYWDYKLDGWRDKPVYYIKYPTKVKLFNEQSWCEFYNVVYYNDAEREINEMVMRILRIVYRDCKSYEVLAYCEDDLISFDDVFIFGGTV